MSLSKTEHLDRERPRVGRAADGRGHYVRVTRRGGERLKGGPIRERVGARLDREQVRVDLLQDLELEFLDRILVFQKDGRAPVDCDQLLDDLS